MSGTGLFIRELCLCDKQYLGTGLGGRYFLNLANPLTHHSSLPQIQPLSLVALVTSPTLRPKVYATLGELFNMTPRSIRLVAEDRKYLATGREISISKYSPARCPARRIGFRGGRLCTLEINVGRPNSQASFAEI